MYQRFTTATPAMLQRTSTDAGAVQFIDAVALWAASRSKCGVSMTASEGVLGQSPNRLSTGRGVVHYLETLSF